MDCTPRLNDTMIHVLGQFVQGSAAQYRVNSWTGTALVLRTAIKGSKANDIVRCAVISTPLLWGCVLSDKICGTRESSQTSCIISGG
jgi:hypothetical protein